MKVCGFSFIRNAVKYDYPIREALLSIAPLCDKIYVAVGDSEDETLQMVQSLLEDKIVIIETEWDDSKREGGAVLAEETNKALDAIPETFDWCVYIQGDEVLHEAGIENIRSDMKTHLNNQKVEGLLLKYRHFYGSYSYLGDSRNWYRNEIRVVRNDKRIRSYKDAQGFRKEGRKLNVKKTNAYVHHYGWVKHPLQQQLKMQSFNKYWHSDEWMEQNIPKVENFDYSKIDSLKKFDGAHPKVMQDRIAKINWDFEFDPSSKKLSLKERFSRWIEKITGWRPGEYRNYVEL